MYCNAANGLSCLRLVLSLIFPAVDPFSWQFMVILLICGATDVLDGWVARRYHQESEFGSRLDSLADIVMFVCLAYVIFTHVFFPILVIAMIILIIVLKAISAFIGIRNGFQGLRHNTVNRATGLIVFLSIPLLLHWEPVPVEFVICTIAVLASFYELYLNIEDSRYSS